MASDRGGRALVPAGEAWLLTGFEPFGTFAVNSSWEAASLLADDAPGRLVVERLPVDHERASEGLRNLLETVRPTLAVLCGLAPSPHLRLEQRARKPVQFAGRPGPDEAEGEWPWQASLDAFAAGGLPAQVSRDAGQYVCESSYWSALDHRARTGTSARIMFLHVPPLSDDWPRERIADAMRLLFRIGGEPG